MSVADQAKLEECANFLLNERGYLVIGYYFGGCKVGQIIREVWNVRQDQPFRVIAETTRKDWKEQSRISSRRFDNEFKRGFYVQRDDSENAPSELNKFYRVVRD